MPTGSDTPRRAGRFALGALLGSGAHGSVYEAIDTGNGEEVAIKIFGPACDPSRVRREIAALRLLRVRGVVKLIEEGISEGAAYLAMERVRGSDFPGRPKPARWEELAPTAIALFETLAEVHGAGIVHRDLKPPNVLVDARGRPTVVDFGVSWGANIAPAHTQVGQIIGTPAYLSPEQIRGEPVGPATDLYAAGILIYEALSGVVPHGGSSLGLFYRRVREPAPPLLEVAPSTPRAVSRVIDQLLRINPLERPRSADLVVALLTQSRGAEPVLPRLGSRDPAAEVFEALARGQSVVVVGPRGSGRTPVLEQTMQRCVERGKKVAALVPARLPYASLAPLLPELTGAAEAEIAEVDGLAERALGALLAEGVMVFADDVEACDARSQRLLERLADAGGTVRSRLPMPPGRSRRTITRSPGEVVQVVLRDFDERELRGLFLGGDRVFHTRADAARILYRLTGGRAARISAELTRWGRLGIARWQGAHLAVDPGLIDELDARPSASSLLDAAIPPHLAEIMEWLALCAAGIELEVLARAMKLRRFEVEGLLEELEQLGAARREGSLVTATGCALSSEPWSPATVRAAHRALAAELAPGSPRRLLHLLAGTEPQDLVSSRAIADEAVALARGSVAEGRLPRAVTWLADSVVALRLGDDVSALVAVVAEWVRVAAMVRTPAALDQVLAELARTPQTAVVPNLQRFARASLAVLTGSGNALELAEQVASFDVDELELERQALLVAAARRADLELEQRAVARAAAWAAARGGREALARAASWQGRLCYRESAFAEAARLHHQAARLTGNATVRIDSMLDAASAEMEDLAMPEAQRDAEEAHAAARAARNPLQEARAEWLLRTLAYREDRATEVDEELLSLLPRVGAPDLEALVAFTEAAVAFRLRRPERSRELAQRAHVLWLDLGRATPAAISRCLALAVGAPPQAGELDELVTLARVAPDPVLGIQMLALLVCAAPALRPRVRALATQLAQSIAPRYLPARSDVLSPQEAIELVF